ncbi:FmdB family zinc ribbon protein [Chloroflexota bacterium]
MPIYDCRCQECGKVSEILVPGSVDGRIPVWPGCGSRNLEKLISAPSLSKDRHDTAVPCSGREERCETSPCSTGEGCQ